MVYLLLLLHPGGKLYLPALLELQCPPLAAVVDRHLNDFVLLVYSARLYGKGYLGGKFRDEMLALIKQMQQSGDGAGASSAS